MIERFGSNRGQAIIEFAFILPIMLILVVGIIEFGVIYYDQAMLTNASREGARVAVEYRGKDGGGACIQVSQSEIDTAVNDYLAGKLIDFGGDATWQVLPAVRTAGDSPDCMSTGGTVQRVTVRVQYQHGYLVLPNFLGLGNTINLGAETTMERL